MTVYVDDAQLPYGSMKMSHMMADTLVELHRMADKIGVARRHFQNHPTHPHYDVCKSKRAMAIRCGAKPVTRIELAQMLRARRLTRQDGGRDERRNQRIAAYLADA